MLAAGCSSLDPGTDVYVPSTVEIGGLPEESGELMPAGADWSCLGQPEPLPPRDGEGTVRYTFPMVEWVTNRPLVGREIKVCNRVFPECPEPLEAATTVVDDRREVEVEIPRGQNVFLLLTAPGTVPTVLYFDGPLYDDQTGGRIQMLTPEVTVSLATRLSIPLNPEQGVLAIRAHDCNGAIVSGALYEIDDASGSSIPYTFVNGLPDAAKPPAPSTITSIVSDNSPWSGFVNVPITSLTVRGFLADDMREFGATTVQVLPGINAIEVRPQNRL